MAEDSPRGDIDWEAIEASPEFQELVKKRKSFVVPGTIFFLTWYMGFILLVAYAEGFMSESVYEGLTVGYCLALTQFLMVVVLGIWYLRKSDRDFDPLRADIVRKWGGGGGGLPPSGNGGPRRDEPVGARAATAEADR